MENGEAPCWFSSVCESFADLFAPSVQLSLDFHLLIHHHDLRASSSSSSVASSCPPFKQHRGGLRRSDLTPPPMCSAFFTFFIYRFRLDFVVTRS